MANESFQDVIAGPGRSIRRIPVNKKSKTMKEEDSGIHSRIFGGGESSDKGSFSRKKKYSRFGIWIIAGISILVLFLIISVLFSGVKMKVTPKQEAVLIDGNFTAFRNSQSGELGFEIMTITRELADEVPATSEEFVEEKASGNIVVYNNYSSAGQKLIKNTRFETPAGLIYRIKDAVVVPGRKTVSGEVVPGSLEVTIYADKPGETYNTDSADFTIPGLKGDPRYTKFYAKNKGSISGGVSGNVRKASPEDLAKLTSELDEKLRAEVLEEASSVKPEGFVLMDNSYLLRTNSKTSNGSDGNVLITQSVVFYGIIFNESDFAKFIAENTIASYDGSVVMLDGLDELTINIDSPESINPSSLESISFSLTGTTRVVWDFDEEALIADLKGQSKSRVNSVLSNYPSIESVDVSIRPFWKRSITENEKKIKLETEIK